MTTKRHARPSRLRGGVRRSFAALAALAMVGIGAVAAAAPAPSETPAQAASCGSTNPMGGATPIGSENGYSVFVRENALLANSELEGALAVGGTAKFGDSRGQGGNQYPIVHQIAGNADYEVPTIANEPNRLLIQEFDPAGGKVVQVKGQGGSGTNAEAGAKIGDQSTPAGYTFGKGFGSSGTTFFPADGGNQSPQIESEVQPWTDLPAAQKSWGIQGNVLSQFPVDSGTQLLNDPSTVWEPLQAPSDQNNPYNLTGPTRVELKDFKPGNNKFRLSGYSQGSFLVIAVSQSDVINGKLILPELDHAGSSSAAASYVLFDLSNVKGDVEVTGPGNRVRGAIYAPDAHIIFPVGGPQYEGQLIAKHFTALQGGEEMHSNIFAGRFSSGGECNADGTFSLRKVLSGVEAAVFPVGTTFPVTAKWDGGEETFNLPVDGSVVAGPRELPVGTKVTFTEVKVPDVEGYTFKGVAFSPQTLTIEDGKNLQVTATNTYEKGALAVTGATGVTVLAVAGAMFLVAGVTMLVLRRRQAL